MAVDNQTLISYFASNSNQTMCMRIFLFLFISLTFLLSGCTQQTDEDQKSAPSLNGEIPLPSQVKNLTSTDRLYFIDAESTISDTLIKGERHWRANGDFFFKIDGKKFPLFIYTSLMKLEVMEPSMFRITAYDRDQGQSVESLKGKIKISKNYNSPFPEPDTLGENNLYMVNKSIDLSEKEVLEDDKLLNWWGKVNTQH